MTVEVVTCLFDFNSTINNLQWDISRTGFKLRAIEQTRKVNKEKRMSFCNVPIFLLLRM